MEETGGDSSKKDDEKDNPEDGDDGAVGQSQVEGQGGAGRGALLQPQLNWKN